MLPFIIKIFDLFLNMSYFILISYNFLLKICYEFAKPIVFCLFKISKSILFRIIETIQTKVEKTRILYKMDNLKVETSSQIDSSKKSKTIKGDYFIFNNNCHLKN